MPYQDEALNQLIINKLSQERYNELSAAGDISANQLYFVEASGNIDAEHGTIENVADPEKATDAANKQYVDSFTTNSLSSYTELTTSNDISSLLNANITYVSSQVSGIPANITYVSSQVSGIPSNITYVSSSLSGYSPKSDVTYVSSQVSGIPANITYVSSQVSGIPSTIIGLSSTVSSNYSLKTDVTYVSSQVSGLLPTINDLTSTVEGIGTSVYIGQDTSEGAYLLGYLKAIPLENPMGSYRDTIESNFLVRPADSIDCAIYYTQLTDLKTNESKIYELSSSQFADVLSAGKIIASRDYVDGRFDTFDLSEYAKVSSVTNLSSSLLGYSPKSDVTYVSSQVSGIPSDILDISNSLSGYVSISGDTILGSIYFVDNVGGPNSTTINNTNIIFSESNRTETKESCLNKNSLQIYSRSYPYGIQTGSFSPYITNTLNITNSNIQYQSITAMSESSSESTGGLYSFPAHSGTFVVDSQLSSYSLKSEVSSTINKVSNIASSLSALSDISQISAEYTIDEVVQKLNEVIIRINTLTTSLK